MRRMGDDELIGLAKASEETGLSREWLRKLFHAGELPGAQRVGNTIGIPRRHVVRLRDTPRRHGGWPKGKPRKPTP